MTAKDYLTALKVIREIQRKQAYCSGSSKPFLAETLKTIELYCPLDFSKTGGRMIKEEKDKVHGCSCCNCGLESELWTFLWESKVEGSKFYNCERCGELIEVKDGQVM